MKKKVKSLFLDENNNIYLHFEDTSFMHIVPATESGSVAKVVFVEGVTKINIDAKYIHVEF